METCGLCLKPIEGEGVEFVTIKKYWKKGDEEGAYFFYHRLCFQEVK